MRSRHAGPVPFSVYHVAPTRSGGGRTPRTPARVLPTTTIGALSLFVVIAGVVVVRNAMVDRASFRIDSRGTQARDLPATSRARGPAEGDISGSWGVDRRLGEASRGELLPDADGVQESGRSGAIIFPHLASPVEARPSAGREGAEGAEPARQPARTVDQARKRPSPAVDAAPLDQGEKSSPGRHSVRAPRAGPWGSPTAPSPSGTIANAGAADGALAATDPRSAQEGARAGASRHIARRSPLPARLSQGKLISPDPSSARDNFVTATALEDGRPLSPAEGLLPGPNETALAADAPGGNVVTGVSGELLLLSEPQSRGDLPMPLGAASAVDEPSSMGPSPEVGAPSTSEAGMSGLLPVRDALPPDTAVHTELAPVGDRLGRAQASYPMRSTPDRRQRIDAPPTDAGGEAGMLEEHSEVILSPTGREREQASSANFRMTTVSFADAASGEPGGVEAAGGILPLRRTAEGDVSVRLDDLIGLLERRMERPLFVWLKSSASASKYVTFETLRSAGICVDYDEAANHVALSVPPPAGCTAR